MENILEIENLSIKFRMYARGLRQIDVQAVNNMTLNVQKGEIVAVIGASGSGKSLLAHAILGILPHNAQIYGKMLYKNKPLDIDRQCELRGKDIVLVPQSVSYLDPLMKVGEQMRGLYGTNEGQRRIFEEFSLREDVADKYPFQLSGGMARRILVGMAMLSDASLVIADEPTPGLTLELAEKTMRYFRKMADEGRAVLLITHDIDLAVEFADRVAVFYEGTVLETASADSFKNGGEDLIHPYSKALWNALPQNAFEVIEWNNDKMA